MQDDEVKKDPEIETPTIEPEDDVVEFVFNDDGEEDLKATLKKLRKDLKETKAKEAEYLTALQRERADFINYKKDDLERARNLKKNAEENVILDLLPALDSYDMAFANKEAWEKVDQNWRTGVEYIHQQILKAIAEYGVEPVQTKVGDVFDSNLHQSIEVVPTDDASKDHTIASITQTGYRIGERILRPARVNVYSKV